MPSEPAPSETASSVSRRTVLRLGSGGLLAALIGVGAGVLDRREETASETAPLSPTTSTSTSAAPVVIPSLGLVDAGVIALGERIIAVTGEDDLTTLLATLPDADDDPVRAAATVTREEFGRGETIDVDGWILAAAEARAAAVVALLCRDTEC